MANFLRWSIFYANSRVLIPTSEKTTAGVRRIIDPMQVVNVEHTDDLKRAILVTIAKGNPIVPHPSQDEMSKPVDFHKKLGFKSYKAFNHTAILWSMDLDDGIYEIGFTKIAQDGRGYDSDTSKTITFPSGTPVETVVDKLIEIIQETHRQKMIEGNKE